LSFYRIYNLWTLLPVLRGLYPFSSARISQSRTTKIFGRRFAQQHPAAMVGLVSAAGLVGFLSEPDPELRSFALKQLDSQVDLLWTELANSVGQM
jgi:hypothetical protein